MAKTGTTATRERILQGLTGLAKSIGDIDVLAGLLSSRAATEKEAEKKDGDLTLAECHFIQAVGARPSINCTALAQNLGLTKGGISKMASRLVGKGLIETAKVSGNRKIVCYILTERGRTVDALHRTLHEMAEKLLWKRLAKYDFERLELFGGMLEDIIRSLASVTDDIQSNAESYLGEMPPRPISSAPAPRTPRRSAPGRCAGRTRG